LRFGFDEIYEKLRWLDKVTSLEIASQLQAPYLQKLLDRVACDVLFSEYQDIAESLNTMAIA
jgi:hypothetical protein